MKQQVWLTSLAVHAFGTWTCFVSDSSGGIEVLKKGTEDNEIERLMTRFTKRLTRHCRYDYHQ